MGPQLPPPQLLDYCASAEPQAAYPVPATQSPGLIATSGSGGYYYTTLCRGFVVDIKMATYSNTNPVNGVPTNPTGALLISAAPYDLPSSQAFGGSVPIVEEDCGRLKWWARYYLKRHDEDHFTKLTDFKTTTNWQSNSCHLVAPLGSITANVSEAGWDTYRVAARAILRSSAQEVAVLFTQPPPE